MLYSNSDTCKYRRKPLGVSKWKLISTFERCVKSQCFGQCSFKIDQMNLRDKPSANSWHRACENFSNINRRLSQRVLKVVIKISEKWKEFSCLSQSDRCKFLKKKNWMLSPHPNVGKFPCHTLFLESLYILLGTVLLQTIPFGTPSTFPWMKWTQWEH